MTGGTCLLTAELRGEGGRVNHEHVGPCPSSVSTDLRQF